MSSKVTTWVFEHSEARGNDRLVLFAIADEADDDGTDAYPGIERISHKARLPKRTVMRCLERLEALIELRVDRPEKRGRGHHNTYVVLMGRGDSGAAEKDDTLAPFDGQEKARKGAQRRAPLANPSQTHRPIDPKEESKPAPRKSDDSARALTKRAWERLNPKPGTPFIAAVKIAEKLLAAGHTAKAIEDAMVAVPTISVGWLEGKLNDRKRRPTHLPPADRPENQIDRNLPSGVIKL